MKTSTVGIAAGATAVVAAAAVAGYVALSGSSSDDTAGPNTTTTSTSNSATPGSQQAPPPDLPVGWGSYTFDGGTNGGEGTAEITCNWQRNLEWEGQNYGDRLVARFNGDVETQVVILFPPGGKPPEVERVAILEKWEDKFSVQTQQAIPPQPDMPTVTFRDGGLITVKGKAYEESEMGGWPLGTPRYAVEMSVHCPPDEASSTATSAAPAPEQTTAPAPTGPSSGASTAPPSTALPTSSAPASSPTPSQPSSAQQSTPAPPPVIEVPTIPNLPVPDAPGPAEEGGESFG